MELLARPDAVRTPSGRVGLRSVSVLVCSLDSSVFLDAKVVDSVRIVVGILIASLFPRLPSSWWEWCDLLVGGGGVSTMTAYFPSILIMDQFVGREVNSCFLTVALHSEHLTVAA